LEVKILKETDEKIKFIVQGIDSTLAGELRRIMMSEIPIMAIDSVDFTENESVLYNEVIAHRLGLIPLVFDIKKFHFKEEDEKADSLSEVVLVISKKGPGMVYTKDIKSSDPDVKPLYDNIPIVELFDAQKLKLEASASLGYAKNHARYQAAIAHYRYFPTAVLKDKLTNPEEVMKSCPKNAIKIDGEKVSVTMDCDLCKECIKVAKPKGVLQIEGDPTRFIFNVESISGLNPEEIVLSAIDILKEKAKDFGKEVKKLK